MRNGGTVILLAALLFVALVGGTDAGRYLTSIRAITALIGAGMIVVWLRRVRQADLVDRLVLGALLFFLVACMLSNYPRDSFEAATSALAFGAAAFVARGALATQRSQDLAVTILALCGIVLSAAFALVWGASWLWWFEASGGMLPPLDLILPVGPYRHYHVVGTTMALLMPALFVLARRPLVWPLAIIGTVCSASVVLMSGSRTVWFALLGGLLVTLAGLAAQGRLRLPRAWWWGLGSVAGAAVVMVVVTGLAGAIMTRLLGSSTLSLRGALWEATIGRWLLDPVFGAGPGSFSTDITLSGFFASYDGIGRHADNAVIQVMAEAGLLGLAAVAVIVSAAVIGLRRRGWPLAPTAALAIFSLASFTDNPSDSAHLVVIALVWFALATPRPRSTRLPSGTRSPALIVSLASAGVIAIASAALLAGSWAYDSARTMRAMGNEPATIELLSNAATLDPSFSLYQRELGLARLATGDPLGASARLERASALNPGDLTTLRIRAFLAAISHEWASARTFANRAVELGGSRAVNSIMKAYILRKDQQSAGQEALVLALRLDPWLAASPGWTQHFASGQDLRDLLRQARESWLSSPDATRRHFTAEAWINGLLGLDTPSSATRADEAMNAMLRCDLARADAILEGLSEVEKGTVNGMVAQLLRARIGHGDAPDVLIMLHLRYPALWHRALVEQPAKSPLTDPEEDARLYRRLAMPPADFGPLLPDADAGFGAWLRDPIAAADVGGPGSGLAGCR